MTDAHFSLGILSVGGALVLPAAYFVRYLLRRSGAWFKGEEGPKDRVIPFMLLWAVLGFGIGSFAQPLWNKGAACQAAGQPVVPCVMAN